MAADWPQLADVKALLRVEDTSDDALIADETRRVLENLKAILAAGGSSLDRVVKATVFLRDMADFAEMNAVYKEYFPGVAPARSTVAVVGLPLGVSVEIDLVALVGADSAS